MDRGAWQTAVHGVTKSQTEWLNNKQGSVWGFPGGSAIKNLSASQETWDFGLILGGEDPLEEEMATHSSVLAWRNPRTEEPGGQELDTTKVPEHGAGSVLP